MPWFDGDVRGLLGNSEVTRSFSNGLFLSQVHSVLFLEELRLRGPSVTIAYRVVYDQFSGSPTDRRRVFQGPLF